MNHLIELARERIELGTQQPSDEQLQKWKRQGEGFGKNQASGTHIAAGGLVGSHLARDKAGLNKKEAREAMRKKYGDDWSKKTGGKAVVNPNTGKPYKSGAKAGKLQGGVRGAGVDKHYKKLKAGRKGMMGYGLLAGAAMGGIASHYARKKKD